MKIKPSTVETTTFYFSDFDLSILFADDKSANDFLSTFSKELTNKFFMIFLTKVV